MPNTSHPYILALGDSLTACYGLPPAASFVARLEAVLHRLPRLLFLSKECCRPPRCRSAVMF